MSAITKKQVLIGVDLSYSINKKSYNLIDASSFNQFCKSTLDIADGVGSVHKVISFGADRYGVIHTPPSTKTHAITGFICNKNAYNPLNESVQKALQKIHDLTGFVFCNTASGQQIIMFNNKTSQFKTIDLFDKKEQAQLKQANSYKTNDEKQPQPQPPPPEQKEDVKQPENEPEPQPEPEPELEPQPQPEPEPEPENENENEHETAAEIASEEHKGKKERKNVKKKKRDRRKSSNTPTFKVKSSIKEVFKHLLLTANGSLYGLQKSFHKKYVNNQRVTAVKCDGNRCTLCLDENGVLWSFGVNLFGKLGLKRNDKKQIYTNPREISIFKAYKVSDFGITNRCCIAVCANGSIYGWGSYRGSGKRMQGGDIWYTPYLISVENEADYEVDYDQKAKEKQVYRVYAGYRFIMLLNVTANKLYCINTEFGYTLMKKARHGLVVETAEIKLADGLVIKEVVPSNESAMIVAYGEEENMDVSVDMDM